MEGTFDGLGPATSLTGILVRLLLLGTVIMTPPGAFAREVAISAHPSRVRDPAAYLPAGMNYARVTRSVPVHAELTDIAANRAFTKHGDDEARIWVNVLRTTTVGENRYSFVRWDWGKEGWIPTNALSFTPTFSPLRGVELEQLGDRRLAMVFIEQLHVRAAPDPFDHSNILGTIRKYDVVTIHDTRRVGGADWFMIAPEQWIHGGYVRVFSPGRRPEGVGPDEKWIEVNVTKQTAIAHEGDTPVYATLVSTGRPGRETITGLFRPWGMFRSAPMRGAAFGLSYDFADVPWIAYFHGSFGWHGTYWHDNFGTAQSAGCVNMSPFDANWFFEWADPDLPAGRDEIRPTADSPGTWVYVRR